MSPLALEIFGTFASIVIAASLMMKNLKRLRLINLAGALLFALYGLGIKSLPVLVVNAFIACIDAWYLLRLRRERADFSLLHIGRDGAEYLDAFLAYYKADIGKYAPSFVRESATDAEAVFVLRDMVPASLVLYRRRDEGAIDVVLDYAVPAYRDYRNAEFFFAAAAKDIAKGSEARFYERSGTKAHVAYLEHLGFLPAEGAASGEGKEPEYIKTVRS